MFVVLGVFSNMFENTFGHFFYGLAKLGLPWITFFQFINKFVKRGYSIARHNLPPR